MGTSITGPDRNAATWPVICEVGTFPARNPTRPTGDALVGGAYPSLLADGSDATYINEKGATDYYRIGCNGFTLPANARITMASPYVRARRHSGNTKYTDFVLGFGKLTSLFSNTYADIATSHISPSTTITGFAGPSKTVSQNGNLLDANDMAAGLYILFGGNTNYGVAPSGSGWDITQAWMRYTYDLPPTCVVSAPASGSTLYTTATPIVTWNYTDDFQPQAKYQVTIYNTGTTINPVYDSGVVTSSNTYHAITSNLPNGTYDAYVTVYQAWSGPADFPASTPSVTTFTISLLPLSTPRIVATPDGSASFINLIVYPDINVMSYNGSTFDNNVLEVSGLVNCTLAPSNTHVRDGVQAGLINITASASASFTMNTLYTSANAGSGAAGPNKFPASSYKGQAYFYASGISGRTAQLSIKFYDATGTLLGTTAGAITTLVSNTFTNVTVTSAAAPAGTVYTSLTATFASTTAGDNIYADDLGIWPLGGTSGMPSWTRGGMFDYSPNLLSDIDSSFESNAISWLPENTNIAMSVTNAQGLVGTQSLALGIIATGGPPALGTGAIYNLAVIPGETISVGYRVRASTDARTVDSGISWYDVTGALISQIGLGTLVDSTTQWLPAGIYTTVSATAPAGAVLAQISLNAFSLTTTREAHYFDAVAVYSNANNPGSAYYRGTPANTDPAPTLYIQYSDDGGLTWNDLFDIVCDIMSDHYQFNDYTSKANIPRRYRAYLAKDEAGLNLQSPYSIAASGSIPLTRVWLHAESDPAGTAYQFQWDGGGRAQSDDMLPTLTQVEGLEYPFAQFGTQSAGSVDVTLHLDTPADIAAFYAIEQAKSTVIFRDQRGRSVRGVLNSVKLTDAPYGNAQDVTLTVQLTGLQP